MKKIRTKRTLHSDASRLSCGVMYLCSEDTFRRIQNRLYQLTDTRPESFRFSNMSKQISPGLEEHSRII